MRSLRAHVGTLLTAVALLISGCTGSSEPSTTPAEPPTVVPASTGDSTATARRVLPTMRPRARPSPAITLRDFPAFPDQPFSEPVAASLQG